MIEVTLDDKRWLGLNMRLPDCPTVLNVSFQALCQRGDPAAIGRLIAGHYHALFGIRAETQQRSRRSRMTAKGSEIQRDAACALCANDS